MKEEVLFLRNVGKNLVQNIEESTRHESWIREKDKVKVISKESSS